MLKFINDLEESIIKIGWTKEDVLKEVYKMRKQYKDAGYPKTQIIPKHITCFIVSDTMNNMFERSLKALMIKGITKEKFLLLYGKQYGNKKWQQYCNKQSITNTYEYKKEKYNMTVEEFNDFNKQRAVTKELCIKRHGNTKGIQIWNDYIEKQRYTNTLEYFLEKYGKKSGKEKWLQYNKLKSHSLESFLIKDSINGEKNYIQYHKNTKINTFYSLQSTELFDSIMKKIPDIKVYYGGLNKEFGKYSKKLKQYCYYDFVIPEIYFCIEYNGDVYHGNPELYEANDTPNPHNKNIKAKDMWKKDKIKNQLLIDAGFDVIVVWEKDYINNKNVIINQLVKYIKDKIDNR